MVNFFQLLVKVPPIRPMRVEKRCLDLPSIAPLPQSITLSRELLCADACLMANAHTKVGYSRLINATFRLRNTRGKQKSRVSAPFSSFILPEGGGPTTDLVRGADGGGPPRCTDAPNVGSPDADRTGLIVVPWYHQAELDARVQQPVALFPAATRKRGDEARGDDAAGGYSTGGA